MNVRTFDEVYIPRRKREKYTALEERQMWHFFASELRAGNEDALNKRQSLWKLYEKTEVTRKKMLGLESHFRKYMLPRIHMASITSNDMFLLLRFFKVHLNRVQQKFLAERFGCDIECDIDNSFCKARFSAAVRSKEYTLPTEEEEDILRRDDDNLTAQLDSTIPEEKDDVTDRPDLYILEEEDNVTDQPDGHIPEEEHNVTDQPDGHIPEEEHNVTDQPDGHIPEEVNNVADQLDGIPAAGKPQISKPSDELRLKATFIKGSINVLERKIKPRLFLEPFLWNNGGKYEKYARGIQWLVSEENDLEFAYSGSQSHV